MSITFHFSIGSSKVHITALEIYHEHLYIALYFYVDPSYLRICPVHSTLLTLVSDAKQRCSPNDHIHLLAVFQLIYNSLATKLQSPQYLYSLMASCLNFRVYYTILNSLGTLHKQCNIQQNSDIFANCHYTMKEAHVESPQTSVAQQVQE